MKHIFTHVTVVDGNSPYHNQEVNVLVQADQIVAIGKDVKDDKAKEINLQGTCVSPGWVALHANFSDPGFEERETIDSGAKAAAAGGFTSAVLASATQPIVQTKSDVEYALKKGDDTAINIYPLGAVSANHNGEEITEMFDMHQAGAVGFFDNKKALKNPNLLKTALLYAHNIAPIVVHSSHPDLTKGGQMHEGPTSTFLGLKGMPAFAEELMISRDIFIAEYTHGRIHFAGVSTAGSVHLIREAKAKGLRVTADVSFYNLLFTDQELTQYNTNFKLNPPLRLQEDIDALIEGLKDGTIDAIAADHWPLDIERKRCEFEHASFGIGAIELVFAALNPAIKKLGLTTLVEKLSTGPRAVLDLPKLTIKEGAIAELTFFTPEKTVNLAAKDAFSKAANNPFLNQNLTGKIVGIFNKQKFVTAHK